MNKSLLVSGTQQHFLNCRRGLPDDLLVIDELRSGIVRVCNDPEVVGIVVRTKGGRRSVLNSAS